MRYNILGLLGVLVVAGSAHSYSDIVSPNAGEMAMMSSMRTVIDNNNILKSKNIILGAGVSGVEAFKNPAAGDTIHILLTWQWLNSMKELAKGTIIVVPSHAIDKNFKAIEDEMRIIPIQGVLHTKTVESVRQADVSKINKGTKFIVMLAGDTQREDGTYAMYTIPMVDDLIKYLPTDEHILFLNGPRTGKFKEVNGKLAIDDQAHRNKIDAITKYVIEKSAGTKWEVRDFKYDEQSLWDPALKYYLDTSSTILILPGESTSMISEVHALGIRPAIYKHPAMTDSTVKYVDQLISKDQATLYPNLPTEENRMQEPIEPQENVVVRELGSIFSQEEINKGVYKRISY
jgi:hypothetical protein